MGLFPYSCELCRGGDFRCGRNKDECDPECKGSQCCWEPEIVLVLIQNEKTIVIKNEYDGYGKMYIKKEQDNIVNWDDFGLMLVKETYFNPKTSEYRIQSLIKLNDYEGRKNDIAKVYCKTCYNK